jgi:hypothetical protein
MWRFALLLFGAFGFVSGSIKEASATVINIEYSGQITSGCAPGGPTCSVQFDGQAFTVHYIFDTDAAGQIYTGVFGGTPGTYVNTGTSSTLSGTYGAITGGTFVGNGVISAGYGSGFFGVPPQMCLNWAGCNASESDTAVAGTTYAQSISVTIPNEEWFSLSTSLFANPLIPGDITSPFSLTGDDLGTGSFSYTMNPGLVMCQTWGSPCISGQLRIESISVSTVPLPPSWLLMISAFMALGLFGWRRTCRAFIATSIHVDGRR